VTHTLLLADDSVTIQRVIELTFADEDVQVVAVGDGDQAIARLEERPPDIVLADVAMPGKTGYEVASYMRQSKRLAHIPVLLLTGAFEPVDERKMAEARCDGVLAKPFEPQLVIGRVKELLGLPGAEAASSSANAAMSSSQQVGSAAGLAAGDGESEASASLVDYLDQLGASLANAPSERRAASGTTTSGPAPASPGQINDANAWDMSFGDSADTDAADSRPSPEAAPERASPWPPAHLAADGSRSSPELQSVVVQLPRASQPALPALAEAFSALLAVEQGTPGPAAAAWPVQAAPITDELVERIVEQVLQRLSDKVVRETVSGLVSTVAERLVREEIERIKASIK